LDPARRLDPAAWLWLLVMPFLAIAVLSAFMPPGILWGDEPNGYDVVEYHLQVPREWFEAGGIVPLHHNVFSYFPFNVEMHYLLAMLLRGSPWAGMYLAQLMHLAMIVLSIVALWELVTPRGRIGVILAAATPWLALLAPVAYNEGGLLLFGTLAIGWMLRALGGSPGAARQMALSGVFAGLACGVKLTAAPMLVVLIPIGYFAAARFSPISNLKSQISNYKSLALFLLGALLTVSPWLLRNLIWTHNPVFPEAMPLLGRAHFTPEQVARWQSAHAASASERGVANRLHATWSQIFADWRYGYALFPAAALAVIAALRRKTRQIDGPFLAVLMLLLGWLVFWIAFTHLQSRFFALAIPAAALLVARIEQPIARLVIVCAILLQVGFGLLNLHDLMAMRVQPYLVALGIDHFPVLDERLAPVLENPTGDLCLIGDARAFVYEIPMSRLHYRTVFDLDASQHPGDVIAAWMQGFPIRHPGATLYIDYDELRRFARTYGTPPPPDDAAGREVRIQK
jgi:hypothetical protein